jgi:hypothetical protein
METLISTESIDVQAAADNLMKFLSIKQQQQLQQQEQKSTEIEQDSSPNASNHSNDLNEELPNDKNKQSISHDDVKTITTTIAMINALTSSNCSSTSMNSSSESNLSTSNLVDDSNKKSSMNEETYDDFNSELVITSSASSSSSLSSMKRTHLKTLIYELYEIDESESVDEEETVENPSILVESYMEKLPPGKNLKNSLLLAWKKRYFKLNSLGTLYVYDLDDNGKPLSEPNEVYNLMGGRVEYEQNKVISLDDCRGNFLVIRCIHSLDPNDEMYTSWKNALDSQIVDRCDLLWVKPSKLLSNNSTERKVLIVDIGTCSVRAGLYNNKPELPKLFCPTVCSKDKLNR